MLWKVHSSCQAGNIILSVCAGCKTYNQGSAAAPQPQIITHQCDKYFFSKKWIVCLGTAVDILNFYGYIMTIQLRLKHGCRALDIISIYHNLIASIRVLSSCMLPVIKINYFSIYSHFLIFFYFSLNKIHRSKLYFIKEGTMDCQLYSAVCSVKNLLFIAHCPIPEDPRFFTFCTINFT